MPPSLFPLENVETYFGSQGFEIERLGNGLRWNHYDGVTTLEITPVDQHTHDGLVVSEIVTAKHVSPLLNDLSPLMVSQLSRWAMQSALFAGNADSRGEREQEGGDAT